jgi:hypothetical protein
MVRRLVALAGVLAVGTTILAVSLGRSATAVTTDLRLRELVCGEEGAHCDVPDRFRFGDKFVFSLPLVSRADGTRVGRDEGTCFVLHRAAGRMYCDFVAHLADGDVTVQGSLELGIDEAATLAVTGGTGAYEGASGFWRQRGQAVRLHIVTP